MRYDVKFWPCVIFVALLAQLDAAPAHSSGAPKRGIVKAGVKSLSAKTFQEGVINGYRCQIAQYPDFIICTITEGKAEGQQFVLMNNECIDSAQCALSTDVFLLHKYAWGNVYTTEEGQTVFFEGMMV